MNSTELYDKIYREFKDIRNSLKPQKMSIFEELVDLFNDLSESLQSLFIPFTLQSVKKENNFNLFSEAVETVNDYVEQFKQLLQFMITFNNKLLEAPITSPDDKFSSKIDSKIKDVVDFYDKLVITGSQEQVDFVNNSYYTFLLLSRILNTAIKLYNQKFSEYSVQELKNIPNPKFLNIESRINLSNYVIEVLNHIDQLFSH